MSFLLPDGMQTPESAQASLLLDEHLEKMRAMRERNRPSPPPPDASDAQWVAYNLSMLTMSTEAAAESKRFMAEMRALAEAHHARMDRRGHNGFLRWLWAVIRLVRK